MTDMQTCPRARARQRAIDLKERVWALCASIMHISTIDSIPEEEREGWKLCFFSIYSLYGDVRETDLCIGMGMYKCVSQGFGVSKCYQLLEDIGVVTGRSRLSQVHHSPELSLGAVHLAQQSAREAVALLLEDLHRIQALPPLPDPFSETALAA